MIPPELKEVLLQNPRIMSGAICFAGTRVPVEIWLDNRRAGVSVVEFLDAYPSITLEQLNAVIDWEDRRVRSALGLKRAV